MQEAYLVAMYAAVEHEDKSGFHCLSCSVLDDGWRYDVVCTEVKLGSLRLVRALASVV